MRRKRDSGPASASSCWLFVEEAPGPRRFRFRPRRGGATRTFSIQLEISRSNIELWVDDGGLLAPHPDAFAIRTYEGTRNYQHVWPDLRGVV